MCACIVATTSPCGGHSLKARAAAIGYRCGHAGFKCGHAGLNTFLPAARQIWSQSQVILHQQPASVVEGRGGLAFKGERIVDWVWLLWLCWLPGTREDVFNHVNSRNVWNFCVGTGNWSQYWNRFLLVTASWDVWEWLSFADLSVRSFYEESVMFLFGKGALNACYYSFYFEKGRFMHPRSNMYK